MKKLSLFFLMFITLTLMWEENSSVTATPSLLNDFSSAYGKSLPELFSCQICHKSGSNELNPYGRDLAQAGASDCGKFNPPGNHNILETSATCAAYHRQGHNNPLASNCWGCHGTNLEGESAPSCYSCHEKLWNNSSRTNNPSFDPPSSHTIRESDDGVTGLHAPGFKSPFSNGCTSCHGSSLRGGTGPSCYTCHGNEWSDDDDDSHTGSASSHEASFAHFQTTNQTFKSIKDIDSDGDGYSNINEIKQLTNPGDADSNPGDAGAIVLAVKKNWQTNWTSKAGSLKFSLTFNTGNSIDTALPFTLTSDSESFSIPDVKEESSKKVSFTLPKSLLTGLYIGSKDKEEIMLLAGTRKGGTAFKLPFSVKIIGANPTVHQGIKIIIKPLSQDSENGLTVVLKGTKLNSLLKDKDIILSGSKKRIKTDDYSLKANKLTLNISNADLEKMYGVMEEGALYPLGLYSETTENNEVVLLLSEFSASTGGGGGGGGGDTCHSFSPPASHTVKKVAGTCEYLHAPGFSQPLSNGCTACHGTDLGGTTFAPSCTLCHTKNW